jgi:hypothetical protein
MATGEAAGVAAAITCKTGQTPRSIDIHLLQKLLKEQGVVLC